MDQATRRIYMDISVKTDDILRDMAHNLRISKKRVVEEIVNHVASNKAQQKVITSTIKKEG